MSELNVIKRYYEQAVTDDFPHLGGIADDERRIKAVNVRGCHGNTQNVLFYSCAVKDGVLHDLKYDCQYCDPTMYVVAELVGELLEGRPVDALDTITDEQMTEALGGQSRKVIREARTAIRLVDEALSDTTNKQ